MVGLKVGDVTWKEPSVFFPGYDVTWKEHTWGFPGWRRNGKKEVVRLKVGDMERTKWGARLAP